MYKILGLGIIIASVFIAVFAIPNASFIQAQVSREANTNNPATGGGLIACKDADTCTYSAFIETIKKVVNFIVVLGTVIATGILAYAGGLYMTSAANPGNITKAHGMIWSAVVGYLVVLSAWLIVEVILNTLSTKPEFNLLK